MRARLSLIVSGSVNSLAWLLHSHETTMHVPCMSRCCKLILLWRLLVALPCRGQWEYHTMCCCLVCLQLPSVSVVYNASTAGGACEGR
jgi:hypothetical protein